MGLLGGLGEGGVLCRYARQRDGSWRHKHGGRWERMGRHCNCNGRSVEFLPNHLPVLSYIAPPNIIFHKKHHIKMPDKKPTYAQQLMGRELPGNWKVQSMIERMDDQSGGYFSVSYIVKKGNQKAFLKALDYQKTIEEASDAAIALEILTASYNFEREVLDRCKHLSRIITVLDWGKLKLTKINH